MIEEAQPSTRMLQEDVRPLLKRLPLLMMEHILRFERLVNRQVDRIVRIWHASRSVRWFLSFYVLLFAFLACHFLRGDDVVIPVRFVVPLFPQGRGDAFVMLFVPVSFASQSVQERELFRGLAFFVAIARLLWPWVRRLRWLIRGFYRNMGSGPTENF